MTGLGKSTPRGSLQTSSMQPMYSTPNQPFEDVLLRQRNLGQDIIPSPREPKRTESLYTPQKTKLSSTAAPAASSGGGGGFFGKSGKLKVCFQNHEYIHHLSHLSNQRSIPMYNFTSFQRVLTQ